MGDARQSRPSFTRILAGMMDYTPGGFENVTRDQFVGRDAKPVVMGTRAHHLAVCATSEAPFQMVYPTPTRTSPHLNSSGPAWLGQDPGNQRSSR
jgi:hypothetical protein